LDALAIAVSHFKDMLVRDETKALELYKQKVLDEWIKEAYGTIKFKRPRFFKV
jgi:hypothetical protein